MTHPGPHHARHNLVTATKKAASGWTRLSLFETVEAVNQLADFAARRRRRMTAARPIPMTPRPASDEGSGTATN